MENQRLEYLEQKNIELEQRVALLEFKLQLLSEDTNISRLLFEYNVSHNQYVAIMDVMDELRDRIYKKENISHHVFEASVYKIIPDRDGDYHFCEYVAKSFMEDGRWEEVFPHLYRNSLKYANTVNEEK